jgi:hypothetical protein
MSDLVPPARCARSWRLKGGILDWSFLVPAEALSSEDLHALAAKVLAALDGFARPRDVAWTTETGGEGETLPLGEQPDQTLDASWPADATEVDIALDLLCEDIDGEPFSVWNAATIWVESHREEDENANETGYRIVLVLDTDVYAWRSWGHDRDNHRMAERNAPRVNAFLARLRAMGARFLCQKHTDYEGQVDEHGFHRPVETG